MRFPNNSMAAIPTPVAGQTGEMLPFWLARSVPISEAAK
jgi:hypothetical protein